MTARELLEQKVGKRLTERAAVVKGIGKPVVVELTGAGGGRWLIDCAADPATISNGQGKEGAATITMEATVFEQLASGALNPQAAFLTGKVKVAGNLGLAIKLGQLLT